MNEQPAETPDSKPDLSLATWKELYDELASRFQACIFCGEERSSFVKGKGSDADTHFLTSGTRTHARGLGIEVSRSLRERDYYLDEYNRLRMELAAEEDLGYEEGVEDGN